MVDADCTSGVCTGNVCQLPGARETLSDGSLASSKRHEFLRRALPRFTEMELELGKTKNRSLGRRKEELIAALLGCLHCGLGHAAFLRAACAMPDSEVACVVTDWRAASLNDDERAMLLFTEKLTLAPSLVGDAERAALFEAGFDEASVLAIALGASYRHFISRIADLLGVEAEHSEIPRAILEAFGVTSSEIASTLYGKTSRGAACVNRRSKAGGSDTRG